MSGAAEIIIALVLEPCVRTCCTSLNPKPQQSFSSKTALRCFLRLRALTNARALRSGPQGLGGLGGLEG